MIFVRILTLLIALIMLSIWREPRRFKLVNHWWHFLLPADLVAFAWSMGWLS